jgi:hypothetical protein
MPNGIGKEICTNNSQKLLNILRVVDNLDAYLKIVVYDKHLFFNAYKGEVRLNVVDFATNKEVTAWYPLRTNPKKTGDFTITGELQLSIHFKVTSC